jgi:HK97 family phage major capsid protein
MKLNRAFAGKVPLLEDHDWAGEHRLGVIEKIWIEHGTTGWARARFSANEPRAKIVWRDILDGIRSAVSVGYTLGEYEEVEPQNSDDMPTIIVNNWEVLEISSVSVPADPSVGFGREQERGGKLYPVQYRGIRRSMSERQNVSQSDAPQNGNENNDSPGAQSLQLEVIGTRDDERKRARDDEKKRTKEILAIGRGWNCEAEAQRFIDEDRPLDEFRAWVLEKRGNAQSTPAITELGLTRKENRQFSIVKALRELSDPHGPRVLTGLEAEASAAMSKLLKRETGGFFLPPELMIPTRPLFARDQVATPYVAPPWPTVSAPVLGATNLVDQDFLPLIEFLRVWLVVRQAGARMLTGLTGNVVIPRQSGAAQCMWLGEQLPAVTATDQTWGQIGLTPKRLSAWSNISRQLIIQSSPDIENLVRSDLAEVMAAEIDRAALWGSGTGSIPRGVINQAGITRFDFGNAPIYEGYIAAVVAVADARVSPTSGGWIMNPRTWGGGIGTPKFPTSGSDTVITPGNVVIGTPSMLLGYPVYKTQNIPNVDIAPGPPTGPNPYPQTEGLVFFGNWSDLLIGNWAGYEVIVDPYTLATTATLRVISLQFVDLAVRYPQAFAVSTDTAYGNPGAPLARIRTNGPTNGPGQGHEPPHEEAPQSNLLRQGPQPKGK